MPGSDKTEKATPKKREDQRKKGNIFQSKDLISSFSLIASVVFIGVGAPLAWSFLKQQTAYYFTSFSGIKSFNIQTAGLLVGEMVVKFLIVAVPFAVFSMILGVLLSGAQTRFLFLMNQLKPKFTRINPLTGIRKVFSRHVAIELLKSILKVLLISWVVYGDLTSNVTLFQKMTGNDVAASFDSLCGAIYNLALKTGIILAVLGAADFMYQWWDYEKQIGMTKQEIKDEYKQMEGDPKIKSRIRDIQRRIAGMRMMQKVPEADVVIKNPTHYAVALKYDSLKGRAPVLLAKGKDLVALRIIEIAEQNDIAVTENRPLARGLYESVELGREIPEEFYKAVADVLAFVYNLKKRKGKL